MGNDPAQSIAYGGNKPEGRACWTTHEFGIKVPPRSVLWLSFHAYSRQDHWLHCAAEGRRASRFRLREGAQSIRIENEAAGERVFHFLVEPKMSYPTDVRDLGIFLQEVESRALGSDRPLPDGPL